MDRNPKWTVLAKMGCEGRIEAEEFLVATFTTMLNRYKKANESGEFADVQEDLDKHIKMTTDDIERGQTAIKMLKLMLDAIDCIK